MLRTIVIPKIISQEQRAIRSAFQRHCDPNEGFPRMKRNLLAIAKRENDATSSMEMGGGRGQK